MRHSWDLRGQCASLIAVGAGAAASLSLTADPRIVAKPWGQIIDTMIGVEIAISLMPPAAVIGIGLAFGRPEISRNAFWLLVVNVIGLDFLGSTLMLALYRAIEGAGRCGGFFNSMSRGSWLHFHLFGRWPCQGRAAGWLGLCRSHAQVRSKGAMDDPADCEPLRLGAASESKPTMSWEDEVC